MTEAQAYRDGWNACMNGVDGRYTHSEWPHAWQHGFLDAMEAEDGEKPSPEWAVYFVDPDKQEWPTPSDLR